MMRPPALLGLGLALAAFAPLASAQAPPAVAADPARAEDAKALRDLVAGFARAFEAGDAKALASTFTEDARIADDDGTTRGRSNIEARFAAYFAANPKARLAVKVDDLHFPAPDVAIEDGHAVVTTAASGSRPETTKYEVVYVRQGGRWLQSSLRESSTDEATVPERLADLEWLSGEWVNESQAAVVHTTCALSDDKHYLLRDFTVTVAGKPAVKGTQRIGWDPAARRVRSWVFDSLGGFSEGDWTRAGDQWMIKSHGVDHDGEAVTATMTITRVGPGALRWRTFDRTRGGSLVPGVDEYTMVRRPPSPK